MLGGESRIPAAAALVSSLLLFAGHGETTSKKEPSAKEQAILNETVRECLNGRKEFENGVVFLPCEGAPVDEIIAENSPYCAAQYKVPGGTEVHFGMYDIDEEGTKTCFTGRGAR